MNRHLEYMRARMRLAESQFPEDSETVRHGEGRTSTVRGDAAFRERVKMYLLENRDLLFGRRAANGSPMESRCV